MSAADRWPITFGSGPAAVGFRICRVSATTAAGLLGLVGLIAHPAPVLIGWLLATLLVGPFTAMCRHSARPHGAFGHVGAGISATLVTISCVAVLSGLIAVLGAAAGLTMAVLLGSGLVIRWRRHTRTTNETSDKAARSTRPAVTASPATAAVA